MNGKVRKENHQSSEEPAAAAKPRSSSQMSLCLGWKRIEDNSPLYPRFNMIPADAHWYLIPDPGLGLSFASTDHFELPFLDAMLWDELESRTYTLAPQHFALIRIAQEKKQKNKKRTVRGAQYRFCAQKEKKT